LAALEEKGRQELDELDLPGGGMFEAASWTFSVLGITISIYFKEL
jgi:hypothetical protein